MKQKNPQKTVTCNLSNYFQRPAAVLCSSVSYRLGGVELCIFVTGKSRHAWHRCMGTLHGAWSFRFALFGAWWNRQPDVDRRPVKNLSLANLDHEKLSLVDGRPRTWTLSTSVFTNLYITPFKGLFFENLSKTLASLPIPTILNDF